MSRSFLLPMVFFAVHCQQRQPQAQPDAGTHPDAASQPDAGPQPASMLDASASSDGCLEYRSASGRRTFGYRLPGDPASHPGCTLDDLGALQCPRDFSGWTPKSKVVVPTAEAVAVIDSAEASAMAAGCVPCPRDRSARHLPGFDPSSYPAEVCKRSKHQRLCLEVCAPEPRAALPRLRAQYAHTQVASHADLSE